MIVFLLKLATFTESWGLLLNNETKPKTKKKMEMGEERRKGKKYQMTTDEMRAENRSDHIECWTEHWTSTKSLSMLAVFKKFQFLIFPSYVEGSFFAQHRSVSWNISCRLHTTRLSNVLKKSLGLSLKYDHRHHHNTALLKSSRLILKLGRLQILTTDPNHHKTFEILYLGPPWAVSPPFKWTTNSFLMFVYK